MMNMYVMIMIMLWDVNACLTPRGVTALPLIKILSQDLGYEPFVIKILISFFIYSPISQVASPSS
jgi:hypothetical protein